MSRSNKAEEQLQKEPPAPGGAKNGLRAFFNSGKKEQKNGANSKDANGPNSTTNATNAVEAYPANGEFETRLELKSENET